MQVVLAAVLEAPALAGTRDGGSEQDGDGRCPERFARERECQERRDLERAREEATRAKALFRCC